MADFPFRIENIVAVTELGIDIDVDQIGSEEEGSEFEPEKFEGIVSKPKDSRVASVAFPTGRIVSTGAKSFEEAEASIRGMVDKLKEAGNSVPEKYKIEIDNIVAITNTGNTLDLEKLAASIENVEYNPEKLPCLVYKTTDSAITFLLFRNGKVVCTGGQSKNQVSSAFMKIMAELKKNR
jgi:transcription initiation factor TFIID TATA-box-binding protein